MTDYSKGDPTPAELRDALEAADELISKIEDRIGDVLAKTGEADERKAFYDIVEMLETSREIATIRMALGQDPSRWGEPTPVASPANTG